jgi:DNA-directed RNA polymerase III subunit RPC4
VGGGGIFGGGSGGTTALVKHKYEGYAELLDGGMRSSGPKDPSLGDIDVEGVAKQAKSSGRSGGTSKGGNATTSAPTVGETIETTTDDEPDDVNKRDIERIWISSDEDDDAVTSSSRKGKQKATNTSHRTSRAGFGLRPVRAPRTLREDEGKDGQFDTSSSKKRAPTGKKPDSEPQAVSSDDGDGDTMEADTDSVHILKEQLSSPELRKRALKSKPILAVPGKYVRDMKGSANETIEDRAERLREHDDSEKLRHIFAPKAGQIQSIDDGGEEPTAPFENGKLFLFQLPPLTPFLTDPTLTDHLEVKTEPSARADGTTIDLDSIPDAPPPAPTATRMDGPIKADPDPDQSSSKATQNKLQLDGLLTAAETMRLPSGMVGKLNVHRSGKVTLDWGGTDMEVKLGSEVDFLQDVVLVQPPGEKGGEEMDIDGDEGQGGDSGKKESKGRAFALGQVRQKMVLIPDWAKLYD